MRHLINKIFIFILILPVFASGQKIIKIVTNYVLINVDESSGLSIDEKIKVYRNINNREIQIGEIQIIRYNSGKCAGKITEESQPYAVSVGDYIKIKKDADILSENDFWNSNDKKNAEIESTSDVFSEYPAKSESENTPTNEEDDWYEKYATNKKRDRKNASDKNTDWGNSSPAGSGDEIKYGYGMGISLNTSQEKMDIKGYGMSVNSSSDLMSAYGIGADVISNIQMNNYSKFLLGIGYVQKKIQSKPDDEITRTLTMHNLMLSIYGKFGYFNSNNTSVRPYVLCGADMFFKLKGTEKNDDQSTSANSDEYSVTEYMNTIYWGLSFGAGFEMPVDKMTLDLSAQYFLGLSNVYKSDDYFEMKSRINTITIMLVMTFNSN